MANIRCKSCGWRYGYHESELCPHCGAYNRAHSRMRVDFDADGNAELLSEQQFRRQSAENRKRKDTCEGEAEVVGRGNRSAKRTAIRLLCGVLFAVLVLNLGVRYAVRIESVATPEPEITAQEAVAIHMVYGAGETFTIDGQPVTVEEVTPGEERLLVLVQWNNAARQMPELSVVTGTASVVADPHCEEIFRVDVPESMYRYTYRVEGIDWQDTIQAYLLFSSWEGGDTVCVDLTEELLRAADAA